MQYTGAFVSYTRHLASHRYDPIPFEKERELLAQCAEGSTIAFQQIVNSNLRFVPFLIKKKFTVPEDIDIMDLIQEGNLGLIEGVKRFDAAKYEHRVYSYCSYWIYFYVNVYLSGKKKSRNFFLSYDEMEDGEKENLAVVANISETSLISEAQQDIVAKFFNDLPDKERAILVNYFGLNPPYVPKTLQEIGSMFHISLERIRQLKDKSLAKIQKNIISNL